MKQRQHYKWNISSLVFCNGVVLWCFCVDKKQDQRQFGCSQAQMRSWKVLGDRFMKSGWRLEALLALNYSPGYKLGYGLVSESFLKFIIRTEETAGWHILFISLEGLFLVSTFLCFITLSFNKELYQTNYMYVYITDATLNYGKPPLWLNDRETVLSQNINTYRHKHRVQTWMRFLMENRAITVHFSLCYSHTITIFITFRNRSLLYGNIVPNLERFYTWLMFT